MSGFTCVDCNSKTGHDWDSALVQQLRPFCTLLDISRARGQNQPLVVETLSGKALAIRRDGTMTMYDKGVYHSG